MSKYLARLKAESHPGNELPKPSKPLLAVKTVPSVTVYLQNNNTATAIPVAPLPKWQHDLCVFHGGFMGTTEKCPRSEDECFISKLLEVDGDFHQLAGYEIGQGITCGDVLDDCHGEDDEADLRKRPVDFILIAESIQRRRG